MGHTLFHRTLFTPQAGSLSPLYFLYQSPGHSVLSLTEAGLSSPLDCEIDLSGDWSVYVRWQDGAMVVGVQA